MTTRKHFVAVAQTVAAITDPRKRAELAQHHAAIFAADNPRFDRARFLSACNVKSN
jgi:hypothetical protein